MQLKALHQMLPKDKHDVQGARALIALGMPTLTPALPQLVQWLKNLDSPVESEVREFLVRLGAQAVPAVKRGLSSRQGALKYALVTRVLVRWPRAARAELKPELEVMATGSDPYGTDLAALALLLDHALSDRAWLESWARFKSRRLGELYVQARQIEGVLRSSSDDGNDIRGARASDIPMLLPLIQRYWAFERLSGFDADTLARSLQTFFRNDHSGGAWLAFSHGEPVAYLMGVYVFSLEHGGLTAEIDEFLVLEGHRGHGLGRRLLVCAEMAFRARGCRNVSLQLGRGNDAGRAFYMQNGYRPRVAFSILEKTLSVD